MADVSWPSSLQQNLNQAGFSYAPGDTTIRSESDIGPAKVRRRFTRSVDLMGCSIWVNPTQYTTLMNLFNTDLNGGAGVLAFTHPITGSAIRVRFLAPPSYTRVGYNTYEVQMQWEVLP